MSNFEKFMSGIPREQPKPIQHDLNDELKLAHSIGKKRFGSECRHEHTRGGKCTNCLRTVVTKIGGLK